MTSFESSLQARLIAVSRATDRSPSRTHDATKGTHSFKHISIFFSKKESFCVNKCLFATESTQKSAQEVLISTVLISTVLISTFSKSATFFEKVLRIFVVKKVLRIFGGGKDSDSKSKGSAGAPFSLRALQHHRVVHYSRRGLPQRPDFKNSSTKCSSPPSHHHQCLTPHLHVPKRWRQSR